MQASLKSSVSWNTVVLRIFFSEGIVSIDDLIHVDEMFCHSLRQLITRSLMLMAQSFFWLSPSSVITTSIGSGLMITSQIEREKTVGGYVLNTPWPLSGVPHATTRRELRHLWANQWKAFLRGCKNNGGSNSQFDFTVASQWQGTLTVASQWQDTLTVASQWNMIPYRQEGRAQGIEELKRCFEENSAWQICWNAYWKLMRIPVLFLMKSETSAQRR